MMRKIDKTKTKRLHDIATAFHVMSETPKDEACFRGYITGIRRQMTDRVRTNGIEAEAFEELAKRPDSVSRRLGKGYADGIAGVKVVAGEG